MSNIFNKRVLTILTIVLGVILLNSCQKEYTITAIPKDTSMGGVMGGGVYKKGATIQLVAVPASGYRFVKWNDDNTDNPRTIMVEKNATYIAFFNEGSFSVSATTKVYFSPGNLQWSATGGGNTATTHAVVDSGKAVGTWRFAPNQWDIIGADNNNISSTYTGWIDVFGWGTSGYNNKYPYMTSTISTDYGNGWSIILGTNYDWGIYNAIYNPKTNTTDVPRTWRTLTKDEWVYLMETRASTSNIRYAKANVHGINGLIIVPDDWSNDYPLTNVNTKDATYTSNIISAGDWANMEAVGCIFLPAAGFRKENSVNEVGYNGYYWSSNNNDDVEAKNFCFTSNRLGCSNNSRFFGFSVRLVKDVK